MMIKKKKKKKFSYEVISLFFVCTVVASNSYRAIAIYLIDVSFVANKYLYMSL